VAFTRCRETRECAKPWRDGRLRRARWMLLPLYFVVVLASANAAPAPDSGIQALQARILTLATTATNAEAAFIEATSDCTNVALIVDNAHEPAEDLKCAIVVEMTDQAIDAKTPKHIRDAFVDLLAVASTTNRVSKRVCETEATRALCLPVFEPAWFKAPLSVKPNMQALETWTDETEAALNPLWTALCQHAASKAGRKPDCAP
jgi:hypothetical protein